MSNIKCRGFVLREYDNGESNKNIVLLLKNIGKKYVFVKNAKNPKSKLQAGSKIFTYADYELYEGRNFLTMNETNVIKSFYPISYDYDKFCYSNVISEFTEKNIMEGENCDEILQLILKTFQVIENSHLNEKDILSVYIIKFFQLNGYTPQVDKCLSCGGIFENNVCYFSSEGLYCTYCKVKEENLEIVNSTRLALDYLINADISNLYKFKLSTKVSSDLENISFLMLNTYNNVNLKSLKFI